MAWIVFRGFRQTQITERTEGFIDFPGVLSLNENYLFWKSANQSQGRPGGHRIWLANI